MSVRKYVMTKMVTTLIVVSSNWRTLPEAIAFARKLQEDAPEFSIILH